MPILSKPKKRFPILKLHSVILFNCIEHLDVLEVILFSLLSKRAKKLAKLVRWSPLYIRSTSHGGPQICLRSSTDPGREYVIDYMKDEKPSEYPYFQSRLIGPQVDHFLFLKNEGNVIEDSKQMVELICEVFRSPIRTIEIDEELLEWIITFQPIIRYVWIFDGVITSVKSLDRIFKSLKATDYFQLGSLAIEGKFQYTEPIPFPYISIRNSYWFTLPSILNGNNSIILLDRSELTSKDINTILKEWQIGFKLRNLEYIKIETFTLLDATSYANQLFESLNMTVGVENDGRPTTVKIGDKRILPLPQGATVFNLTRHDGTILSMSGNYEKLEDNKIKLLFSLQVWRKQA
ncbi:Protein CBG13793 [Caenorhabditis briggsae]|uniref:F-box associated domain-containing protein n=2 Tax=Caenorhabditis briggsae TaxID=6238 RepID=A0AAE9AEN3_CAEBR|nr:Protein CBG13793 [Caenorhabditis briggsae]ULT93328.1 hypothetical protein L3Y34_003068 [Caenorhabditis briggsae]CAP32526.2 Protein CBG13793 [Caenorhabditis briggsae]